MLRRPGDARSAGKLHLLLFHQQQQILVLLNKDYRLQPTLVVIPLVMIAKLKIQ